MSEPSAVNRASGLPPLPRIPRRILGVRIDDVTYNEAIEYCASVIPASGTGPARSIGPSYVVTPNPEFVMLARRHGDFRSILGRSCLSIPDGVGLRIAAGLAGTPLRAQVRGTDLAYGLAALAPERRWRVFLLGAAPGIAEEAAASLGRRFTGIEIAGTFAGDASPDGDVATREAIRQSGRCDLLLVAYGAPKQERWIARNLDGLDVGIAIGVGGVLDFMAGRVRRAPAWVRDAGLDWLYRLVRQPSRWQRQVSTLPAFLVLSLIEAARLRTSRAFASASRPGAARSRQQ